MKGSETNGPNTFPIDRAERKNNGVEENQFRIDLSGLLEELHIRCARLDSNKNLVLFDRRNLIFDTKSLSLDMKNFLFDNRNLLLDMKNLLFDIKNLLLNGKNLLFDDKNLFLDRKSFV